jgi:hypothetical protein
MRVQAFDWLAAELERLRAALKAPGPATRMEAQRRLQGWLEEPFFVPVRETNHIPRMSSHERKKWRSLWREVHLLLAADGRNDF